MGVRVYTTFGNESKQKLPLCFASLSWLACVSNQLWKLWHVASLFLANSQEWKAKHVNQELGILVSLVLRSLIFSLSLSLYIYIYIFARAMLMAPVYPSGRGEKRFAPCNAKGESPFSTSRLSYLYI